MRSPGAALAALVLLTLLAPGSTVDAAGAHKPAAGKPARPPRAPVVVALVVDQLAAWVLEERLGQLPPSGGLARLAREGLRVRDLRYAHAVTETAPGHAALYTGTTPHENGIYGNEVPAVDNCHYGPPPPLPYRDSILLDPDTHPVPGEGCGVSLRALRGLTVADSLRATQPAALIYAISLKDRGAVFGGGRHPNASLWLDGKSPRLQTSSAFGSALPPWVTPINQQLADWVAGGLTWELRDPAWTAAHAGTADDAPGEGGEAASDPKSGYPGLGTTFPHALRGLGALRSSPFGDEVVLRAGLAALDSDPAVGQRPTLLSLSLSSNDYVGHVFGPDSWEAWDEQRRLDEALGAFFAELDQRFSPRGWSALLTGDHGVPHLPEACASERVDRWERPCDRGGRRLEQQPPPAAGPSPGPANFELLARLRELAAEQPGGSPAWIQGVWAPHLYLSNEARAEPQRGRLLAALREAALPGVRRVLDAAQVSQPVCPPVGDESELALVCRALPTGGGGDFYLLTEPGSFFDPIYVRGHGVHHGSPYLYDRAVPLLVRAPGRVAPGVVVDGPVPFAAFTRTLSSLLGVPPPAAAVPAPDYAGAVPRRLPR